MSADPLGSLVDEPLDPQLLVDALVESQLVAQQAPDTPYALVDLSAEQGGQAASQTPPLLQPTERAADFWVDLALERELLASIGDIQQTLASAHELTSLPQARAEYGFLGSGQTVAVIDSGIAWDHTALGGGFGSDYRVVGGWDFTENDANPYDDGPAGAHGTHVAGIVGADRSGTSDDGVAPGVDLVALRVFNDAGDGYFSWVESALRWVIDNRNAFANPITAVNLSLGTTWNSSSVPGWATLEDEFAQLKAAGVFVAVSAGNSFANYNVAGLSYPAASPYVVPVMSVDDSGSLSHFSQRHPRAIAAPGRFIVSTVPDYAGNHNGKTDDYASFSGTSMAAPYVAGASVLIREAMEFAGYVNVTQDTILDHMLATADSFFDAATNGIYKRLNLGRAIDTLMPADDFGSGIADAHDLGTLGGNLSSNQVISGVISTLSDVDSFRFIAATTGTVSVTAATTHNLAASWTLHGGSGTASGAYGETFEFDVVAGQTYTLGLATSGGLGYYELSIDVESAFSFVDWGTVTQAEFKGIGNSGEQWYRIQAGSTGYLTIQSFCSAAGGDISLALYDSNLQMRAAGMATASGGCVEIVADAGGEYFVCVTGDHANIDFRVTNLVSLQGGTVNVQGTATADTFTFAAGATQHVVTVNGTSYILSSDVVTRIDFSGGSGNDAITMTGSAGNDTATIRVSHAMLAGVGFAVSAIDVENVIINSGGGNDTAHFYDTAGDDIYAAWSNRAVLYGGGYWHEVRGFNRTMAHATQGYDRSVFYDTAGNDVFAAWSDRAAMYGSGYFNDARGFDNTTAYATNGYDRAVFYDSAGNDTFAAWSDRAAMYASGYFNDARGFDNATAHATQGYDRAVFYDSAGNDTYVAWPDRAVLYGSGYFNDARGFDNATAHATQGYDRAVFYDSAGNDTYAAWSNRAVLYGSGYFNDARGFDNATARATQGNDRAVFYDSAGNDTMTARAWGAFMSGLEFHNEVRGFDDITAYAISGGDDTCDVEATDYAFALIGDWN